MATGDFVLGGAPGVNEGEDWHRWTRKGLTDRASHDYNLFWPPGQVVEFVQLVDAELKAAGSLNAYRTTEDGKEAYASVGDFPVRQGVVLYDAPGGSVTTFFAVRGD